MSITLAATISNLKICIYTTITYFPLVIQLFGVIFYAMAPLILVMFHLHSQRVKNRMSVFGKYTDNIICEKKTIMVFEI